MIPDQGAYTSPIALRQLRDNPNPTKPEEGTMSSSSSARTAPAHRHVHQQQHTPAGPDHRQRVAARLVPDVSIPGRFSAGPTTSDPAVGPPGQVSAHRPAAVKGKRWPVACHPTHSSPPRGRDWRAQYP